MSDNIPMDIQKEIIKHVPDVKSLLRFRSVSKLWKSFIDSYKFTHHIKPHRFILRYNDSLDHDKEKYICLMDDNDTLTHQQALDPIVPVLIKELKYSSVIGSCNGVFGVYGFKNRSEMVVLWNPSLRKCVGMFVPYLRYEPPMSFGFGVCPVTNYPMIVRIPCNFKCPRQVEVFTLSSGVWNMIPSSNLPPASIRLMSETHVVIDRFIYWAASEGTFDDNGVSHYDCKILSFDMITKDFKVIDVPHSLAKQFYEGITISKHRESLVLLASIKENEELDKLVGSAWMMEHDGVKIYFRNLFTFGIPDSESIIKIHGYRKSGEPIIETKLSQDSAALEVYSPSSKQIHNLEIYGERNSFFMGSHMETLLLLDHADCLIYGSLRQSDLLPSRGRGPACY